VGDQQWYATEESKTAHKKIKSSTDTVSPSVSKLDEQTTVCHFYLAFMLKQDGESSWEYRFSICTYSHSQDIQGLSRKAIYNNSINGSILTDAARNLNQSNSRQK